MRHSTTLFPQLAAILCALVLAAGAQAAPPTFKLQFLGDFQGFALNDGADAAGYYTDPGTSEVRGVLVLAGVLTQPAVLVNAIPRDLTNNRLVTGGFAAGGGGFLYDASTATLTPFSGATATTINGTPVLVMGPGTGWGVNAAGKVTGLGSFCLNSGGSCSSISVPIGVNWTAGVQSPLSPLDAGQAINDADQVATSRRQIVGGVNQYDAIRTEPGGGFTVIGRLGTQDSYSEDINNAGQVVGFAAGGGLNQRAWFWDGSSMAALPDLTGSSGSIARGINESRWIVGRTGTSAVLWQSGLAYELNGLVQGLPAGSSLFLQEAWDVNESGQILVQGFLQDADFNVVGGSFLLTPVDEPLSAWLMLGGLLALTVRLRTKVKP